MNFNIQILQCFNIKIYSCFVIRSILYLMGLELKILLILVCLLSTVLSKPLVSSKVLIALNCGTKDQVVESYDKNFKYQADDAYVSGKSVDVDYHTNDEAKDSDIKYTFDKKIYMYERHTYEEMIYTLPTKVGKITLILKFAQMYFQNSGQRVFNIKIGKTIVRKDLDVVKEAGSKYAAHEEYIEIDIKQDGVYYQGKKIEGGLVKGKLKLSFAKGKADNPIVQAIIVYHDSIDNSPRAEYKQMKEKWQSQKEVQRAMKEEAGLKDLIAIQKKKEKISIRNDQLIVEKNEVVSQKGPARQKFGFLRRLLMGPVGILGWMALFSFAGLVTYKQVFKFSSTSVEEKKGK